MRILVALPVYNEELVLAQNTEKVISFFQEHFPEDECVVVIADNKSTDLTRGVAEDLLKKYPQLQYLYLDKKGKGLAWRSAFLGYQADVYIVMDIDLAVDLQAAELLVENIKNGTDIVIGSRYLKSSSVQRSKWRNLTSEVYRFIVRKYLNTNITDFQCGFKAINNKIKEAILPQTKDNGFFLDTELLMLAEKQGCKIKEIPVNWSDYREKNRKSTVNVFETTIDYLQKVWQLKKRLKKISKNH